MRRYDKLRKKGLEHARGLGHEMGYFLDQLTKQTRSLLGDGKHYAGRAYCMKCSAYIEINAVINHIDGIAMIMPCPNREHEWKDIKVYNRFKGINKAP